jgi:hypothetical protein
MGRGIGMCCYCLFEMERGSEVSEQCTVHVPCTLSLLFSRVRAIGLFVLFARGVRRGCRAEHCFFVYKVLDDLHSLTMCEMTISRTTEAETPTRAASISYPRAVRKNAPQSAPEPIHREHAFQLAKVTQSTIGIS